MTRDEALAAVQANVKNQNLIKHMLATEAIMKTLARKLGQDEGEWGLAGLLHDIDIELTNADLSVHGRPGAEMAGKLGASPQVVHAILCHNEALGAPRASLLDKALYCIDPLTGLVTAGALIRPDKKLAGLQVQSLKKRFGEKRFAAGANREQIAACSELGIQLDAFMALGIEAMQGIAGQLGL
ncbi:MAG: HDIG domain-containing protein [Dehalococcoidia bacterium]|nr:HDIG domain-containing protein [Dehalococcoidia bacterium]